MGDCWDGPKNRHSVTRHYKMWNGMGQTAQPLAPTLVQSRNAPECWGPVVTRCRQAVGVKAFNRYDKRRRAQQSVNTTHRLARDVLRTTPLVVKRMATLREKLAMQQPVSPRVTPETFTFSFSFVAATARAVLIGRASKPVRLRRTNDGKHDSSSTQPGPFLNVALTTGDYDTWRTRRSPPRRTVRRLSSIS